MYFPLCRRTLRLFFTPGRCNISPWLTLFDLRPPPPPLELGAVRDSRSPSSPIPFVSAAVARVCASSAVFRSANLRSRSALTSDARRRASWIRWKVMRKVHDTRVCLFCCNVMSLRRATPFLYIVHISRHGNRAKETNQKGKKNVMMTTTALQPAGTTQKCMTDGADKTVGFWSVRRVNNGEGQNAGWLFLRRVRWWCPYLSRLFFFSLSLK